MTAWWRGELHVSRGGPAATVRTLNTCRRAGRRSDGWRERWIGHAAVVVGSLRQWVISSQIGSNDVGSTVCLLREMRGDAKIRRRKVGKKSSDKAGIDPGHAQKVQGQYFDRCEDDAACFSSKLLIRRIMPLWCHTFGNGLA